MIKININIIKINISIINIFISPQPFWFRFNEARAVAVLITMGFQIFVKALTGGYIALDVNESDTIDNIKAKILDYTWHTLQGYDGGDEIFKAEKYMWDCGRFGLTFAGKQLANSLTISDYNIQKDSNIIMTMGLAGEGKRGRQSNPFDAEETPEVKPGDQPLYTQALNDAVSMLADKNPDMTVLFKQLDAPQLQAMLRFLSTGKHTNEMKTKMLVEMLPQLKAIKTAEEKLNGSHAKIQKLLSAKLWSHISEQSENGSFNMDMVRMMLRTILKDKGADVDMADL